MNNIPTMALQPTITEISFRGKSAEDIGKIAEAILSENVECLVANFIKLHPGIRADEIELCQAPMEMGYKIWVRRRKL